MRYRRALMVALLVCASSTLAAHDLFLKLSDYIVRPNSDVRITALNGTFTTSQNAIARARVADLSLVGAGARQHVDTAQVAAAGTRTAISLRTGAPGTYVVGLSTRPSQITLKGAQFNGYLKEEGLSRVLEARRNAHELDKAATERYAKHVKVIFQVGPARSDSFGAVLGYPVEIVPTRNPYDLHAGDTLKVQLLVNGGHGIGLDALAGGRTASGAAIRTQHLRAGSDGIVAVSVTSAGVWYVKFISMTRATEPGPDYISQWATLTFAVQPSSGKAK